jgi:hypothetical protein
MHSYVQPARMVVYQWRKAKRPPVDVISQPATVREHDVCAVEGMSPNYRCHHFRCYHRWQTRSNESIGIGGGINCWKPCVQRYSEMREVQRGCGVVRRPDGRASVALWCTFINNICVIFTAIITVKIFRAGVCEHVWSPATMTRGRAGTLSRAPPLSEHGDPYFSAANSGKRRVHTHIVSPAEVSTSCGISNHKLPLLSPVTLTHATLPIQACLAASEASPRRPR